MAQSKFIHKSHNVSVLLYHFVFPAKYRRIVLSKEVDITIKEICFDISKRYEIHFLEIGTDQNHIHFLVQSVPSYSATKIVTTIKSLTAREVFRRNPEVKKILWGGEFWSDGYFVSTVGKHASEDIIAKYVREQGDEEKYECLHKVKQLMLF